MAKAEFDKEQILFDIHSGKVTPTKLPKSVYYATADHLKEGINKGYNKQLAGMAFDSPDLDMIEALRTNIYMFSAAKTFQETNELWELLVSEDGEVLSFSDFKKAADMIFDQYNKDWLQAEYNTTISASRSAAKWVDIEANKEDRPYLSYSAVMDEHTCDICAPLDGITLPVDDPFWDSNAIPQHFNCFPKGTKILSPTGWMEIDKVKAGDFVIGGSGEPRKVNFIHSKPFAGELRSITIKNNIVRGLTKNHRVLTSKGFIRSENIYPNDILIQNIEVGFLNKLITQINNVNVVLTHLFVSFKANRKSSLTFNAYFKFRQININKSIINKLIANSLYSFGNNKLVNSFFNRSRLSMIHISFLWIVFVKVCCFLGSIARYGFIKHGIISLHSFAMNCIFNTQSGFRKFLFQIDHKISLLLSPFFISNPLQFNSFASASGFNATMNKNLHNSSIINMPFFAKMFNRKQASDIQINEGFVKGAPLDGFNSLNDFLLKSFFHRKFVLVGSIANVQYNSTIHNITVDKDESYITELGVVHNCECVLLQLDASDIEGDGVKNVITPKILNRKKFKLSTPAQVRKAIVLSGNKKNPMFNYNPARDRVIFKDRGKHKHPYFDIPLKFREFARENFGLPIPDQQKLQAA